MEEPIFPESEWINERQNFPISNQSYCLHDRCPECHGSGKKQDESPCIHYISCGCYKCSVKY